MCTPYLRYFQTPRYRCNAPSALSGTELVYCLGQRLRAGKLAVPNRSCRPFRKPFPPTNQTKLQYLLRVFNVYQGLLSISARSAAPLNFRTETNQHSKLRLSVVKPDAAQKLRKWLTSSTNLALPRYKPWYSLATDACDSQLRRALLQQQPNRDELPVRY